MEPRWWSIDGEREPRKVGETTSKVRWRLSIYKGENGPPGLPQLSIRK